MHIFAYILNVSFVVFISWVVWVFLQMTLASWGHRAAKDKWIDLVNTPFFQLVGVKWISAIALVGSSIQLLILLYMLIASLLLGRPIALEGG